MKKIRHLAFLAMGFLLLGGFFAFQSFEPSAEWELKLQKKDADFRVVPIEAYEGSLDDLPEGTTKFTKVRIDAKTRASNEQTYLRIPN